MEPRFGRGLRAVRVRRGLRQQDVGRIAGTSRALVSKIELGHIESVTVGSLRAVAGPVGATVDVRLRWNGEGLDRLLDEAHSRLVDAFVLVLRACGWEVSAEVSISIWGERGSIDILAFHRMTGVVLVVEVKSVVPDSQATLHGLDRKARLAAEIARDRGRECRSVARLLVVGDSTTSRRRVARFASMYAAALTRRRRPALGPETIGPDRRPHVSARCHPGWRKTPARRRRACQARELGPNDTAGVDGCRSATPQRDPLVQ